MTLAAVRHILLIIAAWSAVSFRPARAEPGQPPAEKFAVILRSSSAETPGPEDTGVLLHALERNDYQGVPVRGRSTPQAPATELSVRMLINALLGRPGGANAVFYYQGPLRLEGGWAKIGQADAEIDVAALAERSGRLRRDRFSITLLLDVVSQNSPGEIEAAVAKAVQPVDTNLHVLLGRREPSVAASPSPMIPALRRALTYDREADRDGNGAVSLTELGAYIKRRLSGEMDIACISARQSDRPLQIARPRPPSLDERIDDFSDELAGVLKSAGVSAVAIPDFEEQAAIEASADAPSLPGYSGPLVPYITRQVRRRAGQAVRNVRMVNERPGEIADAGSVTALAVATVRVAWEKQPVSVDLGGHVTVFQGDAIRRTVVLPPATARLSLDEAGMSGRLNMSPKAALSAGIPWAIDDFDAPPALAPHPMADPGFPLRAYLESKGARLEHSFSADGRRMMVDLGEGDEYTIVVENRTQRDLFLRLLVDGRNTLPDRADDGDALEPAQYVNLTRARCWFCEAGRTYRIAGFYTRVDSEPSADETTGQWKTFRVTDIRDVSPQGDFRAQLGIITAAFYLPVERAKSSMASQPQFATCMGSEEESTLAVYRGDLGPGPLLGDAPINIHYGFQGDGEH